MPDLFSQQQWQEHNSSNFRRSLQGHLHWRTRGALGNTHFNSVWHVHWNICSGFPHSEHGKTRVNNLTSEMNYGMNKSQAKEYLQTGGGRAEGKSTQVPCWCQKSQFEISLLFHIFSTKMWRKRKHFIFFFSFRYYRLSSNFHNELFYFSCSLFIITQYSDTYCPTPTLHATISKLLLVAASRCHSEFKLAWFRV